MCRHSFPILFQRLTCRTTDTGHGYLFTGVDLSLNAAIYGVLRIDYYYSKMITTCKL